MTTETLDTPGHLLSESGIQSAQSGSRAVKVRILGKELQMGCTAQEEEALERAADYVDASMQESRDRNKTLSVEKIAIVTAINIANELLRTKNSGDVDSALSNRLEKMNAKLDSLLES